MHANPKPLPFHLSGLCCSWEMLQPFRETFVYCVSLAVLTVGELVALVALLTLPPKHIHPPFPLATLALPGYSCRGGTPSHRIAARGARGAYLLRLSFKHDFLHVWSLQEDRI